MEHFKVDYDKESDDLFLYGNQKSKGSVEFGDLILDFNAKGKLVGIEMLNATKFLNDCIADKNKISKETVSHVVKCDVEVKQKNNFLFIKLYLIGKNIIIPCPINAPVVTESSPALAYA